MAQRQYELEAPTPSEVVDGKRFLSLSWRGWASKLAAFIGAVSITDGAYNPPNIASGGSTSFAVTVAGVDVLDFAQATFSPLTPGLVLFAHVTAANTVVVTIRNETGGAVDMALGTLRIRTERVI